MGNMPVPHSLRALQGRVGSKPRAQGLLGSFQASGASRISLGSFLLLLAFVCFFFFFFFFFCGGLIALREHNPRTAETESHAPKPPKVFGFALFLSLGAWQVIDLSQSYQGWCAWLKGSKVHGVDGFVGSHKWSSLNIPPVLGGACAFTGFVFKDFRSTTACPHVTARKGLIVVSSSGSLVL